MKLFVSALREKDSENGDTSMTRLIIFGFALAWGFVFMAPSVVLVFSLVLVAFGRMEADQILMVGALGDPMAWLGAVIVLAMPLKVFMQRVAPEDLPTVLGGVFGGLYSRVSAVAGGSSGGKGRADGTDNRFTDRESGD